MTLSQSSSDMWSRNSSLVMPAQDTTTDGGREKQAYGRGRSHTKTHGEAGSAVRGGRSLHLHLLQQAPGGPGLGHVSLEGSMGPAGRPLLAPRPAQQPHSLPCRCPVQVASGHGGPLSGQAHTDGSANAAPRTCGVRTRGVGAGGPGRGQRLTGRLVKFGRAAAEAEGTPTRPERTPSTCDQGQRRAQPERSRHGWPWAGTSPEPIRTQRGRGEGKAWPIVAAAASEDSGYITGASSRPPTAGAWPSTATGAMRSGKMRGPHSPQKTKNAFGAEDPRTLFPVTTPPPRFKQRYKKY